MKKYGKKMIAPIVITIVVVLYFLVYCVVLISLIQTPVLRVLLAVVPLLLGAAMIGVLIQRIREIKGGEEDDLGKY